MKTFVFSLILLTTFSTCRKVDEYRIVNPEFEVLHSNFVGVKAVVMKNMVNNNLDTLDVDLQRFMQDRIEYWIMIWNSRPNQTDSLYFRFFTQASTNKIYTDGVVINYRLHLPELAAYRLQKQPIYSCPIQAILLRFPFQEEYFFCECLASVPANKICNDILIQSRTYNNLQKTTAYTCAGIHNDTAETYCHVATMLPKISLKASDTIIYDYEFVDFIK